ncbi:MULTISPECIES: lytic murein transglycosylase [Methylosinus]|uniref:Lytic murein transglycosylase n=1 Tax=Methylosinus trichosporium (strain ATCC 35070 / NCIMB 11131 / UNIQEM 75 / OB3b) TaxID=595536 RepID=A0A2D2CZ77_METT3|nr:MULTISPECIES: lytic murein transglycosylase [Methylosinus]ATQ68048.1 lytic murein transglycosylase [Methylosinus trichosporium OB3b]OBS53680.1 lytic transglycosylase [Methylosinus sp. 3S-1]
MKKTSRLLTTLAAALLCAAPARADFASCLAGLRHAAAAAGVSARTIESATAGLEPNDAPSFMDKQPEFKTPIWDYLAGLVDDERVEEGRALMRQHGAALQAAEQRYGVDPATVVAVWGVESDFGKNFGKRSVVQSLATLACEARRRNDYFRGELIAALKILDSGDIAPQEFYGSWAGAFGHTQFMPSTFLRTAVDLDGDGRRNIASSAADSLGSTANYLHKSGYRPGLRWGFEVRLPDNYSGPSGRTARQPMSAWASRGVSRLDGEPLGDGSAALLLPAGPNGPAFLVTRNFDAIYSYNAAESYALAISILSDRLRGRPGVQGAWPTDDPGLSRAERREVQALLSRHGYEVGEPDGVIGTRTMQAIADFQGRAGMRADGRAGRKTLNALRDR